MFDKDILKNTEAVIFDLDGTLVDSMWIWHEIDIEYLARFNMVMPDNLQNSIEGMSFYETAVYFKKTFDIPDSLETIMDNWNEMALDKYKNVVPLKEHVREFLQKLSELGIKMGISTSNSRILTESLINAKKIDKYFDAIVTGSEVTKGKPEPDVYLKAAEKLNAEPAKCLVFEDLPFGIMAGKRAGMRTCAVEDTYSARFREEKIKLSDYYIESYKEVL